MPEETTRAPFVFISYSHADSDTADEVCRHLARIEKFAQVWLDKEDIEFGEKWIEEIDTALNAATIAVLLVSPHFVTSEFIRNEELRRILAIQKRQQLTVLPIFVSKCNQYTVKLPDEEVDLSAIQGFGAPKRTLTDMTKGERAGVFAKLHNHICKLIGLPIPISVRARQLWDRVPLAAIITASGTITAILAVYLGWQTMDFNDAVTQFENGSAAGVTELAAHGDKGIHVLIKGLDATDPKLFPQRTVQILETLGKHPDVVEENRRELEEKAANNRAQIESIATMIELNVEKNIQATDHETQQLRQLAKVGVCMNQLLKTEPPDWPGLETRVRVLLRKLPTCD